MTPTIDQIEAALPYVPAGLHCGDLTEPDERREFAEVIHGIVEHAARRPGSPMADWHHQPWPPPSGEPAPNAVCPTCPILAEAVPADEVLARISPKPDMTIAWGITEALIEEAE